MRFGTLLGFVTVLKRSNTDFAVALYLGLAFTLGQFVPIRFLVSCVSPDGTSSFSACVDHQTAFALRPVLLLDKVVKFWSGSR